MTGMMFSALVAPAFAADGNWQTQLQFDRRTASATFNGKTYKLDSNGGKRDIPRQAASTETASPLFDAFFAMAQAELGEAKIASIRDSAFNHGEALACDCFETGKKWTYVWTRDSAYSIDLALARFDPARARRTLEFKLSAVREPSVPQGLYVVQDTGSGGSWPISTDRIVWFLGARHLLDDQVFADKVYKALNDTLAQDRQYVFDAAFGLYRGETSFLDWREQTYPRWTEKDVRFIAESFALSTNVLHYEALRLAQEMAAKRGDEATSARYRGWADALKSAIEKNFWREDRGLYMSYVGNSAGRAQTMEAYDLLGISLAILSGVAEPEHAKRALASYPTYAAGSPVIWPERKDAAIYHNRAIWPFVSAYALKAARATDDAPRIAHELRSILRGAALSGSNMENYEFLTQRVHVEDGKLSGPVVNSPRQLWSVAAALDAVLEGVFGLGIDAAANADPQPKLPAELVPMLFGEHKSIRLVLPERSIVLERPASLDANENLLVADTIRHQGKDTIVVLRGRHVAAAALKFDAPAFAPAEPTGSPLTPTHAQGGLPLRLYDDGKLIATWPTPRATATKAKQDSGAELPDSPYLQTIWNTRFDPATRLESLPGPIAYVAPFEEIQGDWPRHWTAPRDGRFQLRMLYTNSHGPINTGVTAAVKMLAVQCANADQQRVPIVMPHSEGQQLSTAAVFSAHKGQACTFALEQGFNMSFLAHYSRYTGEQGGVNGPVNEAAYGELQVAPLE
jgi:hypothetical protein